MTTPTLKVVSAFAEDIKKLIAETEPALLTDQNVSNAIVESALDNSYKDSTFDDAPPWAGEWDNWEPGDDD